MDDIHIWTVVRKICGGVRVSNWLGSTPILAGAIKSRGLNPQFHFMARVRDCTRQIGTHHFSRFKSCLLSLGVETLEHSPQRSIAMLQARERRALSRGLVFDIKAPLLFYGERDLYCKWSTGTKGLCAEQSQWVQILPLAF